MVKYVLQIKTWRGSTSPVHLLRCGEVDPKRWTGEVDPRHVAGDPPYALVTSCQYEKTGTKFWGDINVSQFITTNKVKKKKQTLLSKVLNCHITKSNDSQHRRTCPFIPRVAGNKTLSRPGKKKKHGQGRRTCDVKTSKDPGDRCIAVGKILCNIIVIPAGLLHKLITWPTFGKHENSSPLKMLLARAERAY